ncbi:hypothetical protein CHL67_04065 [Prosthecochloris sp. GSB1]|uniref:YihY family inner membrane protein n=1 Tax=Prosthecochloris sp. GSB1 TaxID=281093 RepID=UPI000B8D1A47|nr:YihY family inner membrane protein [Prosthecochloris sp. GSB1]ASQ90210.1 hypothetical protein CHL67_04065 [Prosthecochloris sp. GSB1]
MTELLKEKTGRYWNALRTFMFFLWKNFMQDRVLLSAGSLAFQTLLSIVPLMAVILSVLSISPVFESFKRNVEDFILQNFVPASGVMVREYFWEFISNTTSVPTVGGIFLFLIALFLISTIDHTINQIWDVHAPRKLIQGFTLYWTVLTVGPIIIGTGLFASSYVWYTVFTEGPLLEVRTRILSYLPLVNSFLAFFLLYMLVPNRRVRFVHAAWGALLATLLFELSKKWFSFYVTSFATFEHIYGALSVVPLLFFWIYLIWVVALTGAEFVYCLGAMKPEVKERPEFRPLNGMRDVLEVLEHIWLGQQAGEYVNLKKTVRLGNGFDGSKAREIIDYLIRSNHVHVTADGGLALSADIHTLSLYDLYSTMPPELAGGGSGGEGAANEDGCRLDELEDNVRECLRRTMHDPVACFMNTAGERR